MNRSDEHLRDGQIEWLIGAESLGEALPEELQKSAREHLARCQSCRRSLELYSSMDSGIKSLRVRASVTSERGGDCPDGTIWYELAAGHLDQHRTDLLLEHSLQCDRCAAALRQSMHDLNIAISADEDSVLDGLAPSEQSWQRHMAYRMAKAKRANIELTHVPWQRFGRLAWVGWAVAALTASVAITYWLSSRDSTEKANQLIAMAYAEQRTSDFRIGQSAYAPVRVERGVRAARPAALFEAQAIVGRLRDSHTNDPDLLQAEGRVDLVDSNMQAALTVLNQAHDLRPDSTSIAVDLATAYGELGDSGVTEDYQNALELLDKVLQKDPTDQIALFNRALVLERLRNYDNALKDWNTYLERFPQGAWSDEARKRSSHDAELLGKESSAVHGHVPFSKVVRDDANVQHLQGDDEQWLEVALLDWVGSGSQAASDDARAAAKFSSDLHRDVWLSELLSTTGPARARIGIEHLVKAMRANESSDHDQALREVRLAEDEFGRHPNVPGKTRADFEEVYALHRSGKARECVSYARHLLPFAERKHYTWIAAQSAIEIAACDSLLRNYTDAMNELNTAESLATQSAYSSLVLRVRGMRASVENYEGESRAAWSDNLEGLSEYWSGSYPALRGYQFYSDLTSLAEDSRTWCAARDFGEESVREARLSPYEYARAIAEFRLADAAKNCGDAILASAHYQTSVELFSRLPRSETTRLYELDAQIGRLNIEFDLHHAISREEVEVIGPQVMAFEPGLTQLGYFNLLGKMAFGDGDFAEAIRSYDQSISLCLRALSGSSSPASRAGWIQQSALPYRGRVKALIELRQFEKALETWDAYRTTNLGGQSHAVLAADKTVHSSTSDHAVSVTYIDAQDGLDIFVSGKGSLAFHHVEISGPKHSQLVKRFLELCANPRSSIQALNNVSRALYDLYVAPIDAEIRSAELLVFSLDQDDWNLPLGALQDSHGQYLGQRFPLSAVSAPSQRSHLRIPPAITSDDPALFVANPAVDDTNARLFPPLSGAEAETRAAASMFRHARILAGNDADLGNIVDAMQHSSIFHFSGHVEVTPLHTGFLLAPAHNGDASPVISPDGFPVESTRRISLAILASCETGKREASSLTESIAESFMRVGIPNVVASHWTVDSESTSIFMQIFYRNVLSGMSVSRSVQSAANAILKHRETSHPYYWASFGTFGRG